MGTALLRLGYLLCLAGIYVTWMLSFSYVLHIQLPCGGGGGCTAVALSPAARVFGIPAPLIGLAFYLLLAAITARCLVAQKAYRSIAPYLVALVGAIISTGFTVYAVAVLRAECGWCIASNVTACLLALAFGFDRKEGAGSTFARAAARGGSTIFLLASAVVTLVVMGVSTDLAYRGARRFPWNPDALAKTSPAEMVPTDAVVLNADKSGPTVVMFLDLQCGACQETFLNVYGIASKQGLRLAVRHLPHKIHVYSHALAVLSEEAAEQGRGLSFLLGVSRQGIETTKEGLALLRTLKIEESSGFRRVGRERVRRDQSLAARLGLSQTPSLFVVRAGQAPEAASEASLAVLAGPLGPGN